MHLEIKLHIDINYMRLILYILILYGYIFYCGGLFSSRLVYLLYESRGLPLRATVRDSTRIGERRYEVGKILLNNGVSELDAL